MSDTSYIAAVERAQEDARNDKACLDFLERQGQGKLWIARPSITGRGYRLHTFNDGDFPNEAGSATVREAIAKAMGKESA